MIAIGRYFVFMICVTATMSPPPNFLNADLKSFLCEIINLHNNYRTQHGVPELELDDELSDDADDILEKLYNNQSKFIPQNIGMNKGDGEFKTIIDLNAEEAEKLFLKWYNTGEGYNYDKEPSKAIAEKTAPFTQIVWKNTKRMGIKVAVKSNGTYEVVVTYSPRGNKKKHYKNNVLKRITQTSVSIARES